MPVHELADTPVLVTGGAGFIGSHLVAALLAAGARVRVLDDLSSGRQDHLDGLEGEVTLLRGDVRDGAACSRACAGMRLVFHLAGSGSVPLSLTNPVASFEVNAGGTLQILEAARQAGVERVIYASSSSVYGDTTATVHREGEEGRPLSPYALAKRVSEELAESYTRCFGLGTIGLRFFNVYGPRQPVDGPYAAVVPAFLSAASQGQPLRIHGDGEQSRDFTYVGDAVAASLLAATSAAGVQGRAFNVGSGTAITINRLAATIAALTANPRVAAVHAPPRPGEVRHSRADLDAVAAALGYRPHWTLDAGLAVTAAAWPTAAGTPLAVGPSAP